MKQPKKKNPQDATLRNIRALKTRVAEHGLNLRATKLRLDYLTQRLARLERKGR